MRGWRIIKGFENYRVTCRGEIWSVTAGRWLPQRVNPDGYLRVELYRNGVRNWFYVHRLVNKHFKKNPHPRKWTQTNHLDHDRQNNNSYNLEHCNQSLNEEHKKTKRTFQDEQLEIIDKRIAAWKAETPAEIVDLDKVPF